MANVSNLSRLLGSQKNILLSEKKAMEALQKARAARNRYERSVAESLLKSLFDMGLGIENMPFILGAVLDARARGNDEHFIRIGTQYMERGGTTAAPDAETPSAAPASGAGEAHEDAPARERGY